MSAEKAKKTEKTTKATKKAELVAETVPADSKKQPKAKVDIKEAPKAKAGKRSAKAVKEAEAEKAKAERKAAVKTEPKAKASKKPPRSHLERAGKKYREVAKLIDKSKRYTLAEAVELATKTSPVKFDATVELHINLGVDPKQADQNIRGTVSLPAGTGKDLRVAVADDKLLAELEKGVINFDVLVASPEMMPQLGKHAKLLGPKGLMPNPKSGTVAKDTAKAAEEAKAGRLEYRVDSAGIIHVGFGKVSFGAAKLQQNAEAVIGAIKAAKPGSIKADYMKSAYITTSMGPSISLDITSL